MKVGTPQDVDNDTAEFFLKSVQMTTVESLRILWVQHNIFEDVQARAVQGFAWGTSRMWWYDFFWHVFVPSIVECH